jgi:hypothetical protein
VACFVVFELCNLLLKSRLGSMLADILDCFCVKSPTWRWCAPGGLPAAGLAEQWYSSSLDEFADLCLLGASSWRAGWTFTNLVWVQVPA